MTQCGTIKIILGCMFSGKTSSIASEFHKWTSIGKNPLCINYIGDDRYSNVLENNMYTHNHMTVRCVYVAKLSEIEAKIIEECDVILVNEGQFFCDLVENCLVWCEKLNKNIVVSGLDGDFQRHPFGEILKLIPLADSVEKLNAFCTECADGTLAPFSHRKSKEKEQIIVGSLDSYEPLCRKCYLKKNN